MSPTLREVARNAILITTQPHLDIEAILDNDCRRDATLLLPRWSAGNLAEESGVFILSRRTDREEAQQSHVGSYTLGTVKSIPAVRTSPR
jgi:hypothetical protein